jgi:beta-galactosidase
MTLPAAWPAVPGIAYGGDYNPEQWPRETWREDVVLMREAGVNLVSVGIFSWGLLETSEGVFDFSWLDEILDLLHENGIAVDLGTPTASPPAWFFAKYPHARAVTKEGVPMGFGSRGMASHAAPEYIKAIGAFTSELARRYAKHPAVVMWHIHNEYGVPVGEDYSELSVGAFREWLRGRYGTIEALNGAWGTAFWGQHYEEWNHIGAPAAAPSAINQAQKLDFMRFTDAQLRECYIVERDAIRAFADQPITTNFMAHQSFTTELWKWAEIVDIVANDHYLTAADPEGEIGLALAADYTRSLAGGKPWILMEHSTSAVNWQPRNVAKRPGEMARNSLSHLGRGADAILFFQWRASRAGVEKFHSTMLPHAGTDSRVWREVVELGAALGKLEEVKGSTVAADVAVLYDLESIWAQEFEWRPSVDLDPRERIRAYYERLWRDGITVDLAHPSADLSSYKLVVAPASYLLSRADADNLNRYVEQGGTLVVSCFSAIVDEHDAVHEGGFVAPLRESLGLTVEEFLPLRENATVSAVLADGTELAPVVWQEDIRLEGAEVVATHTSGPGAGEPAVTRNAFGAGIGWYVGTVLSVGDLKPVFERVYADAGLAPSGLPERVEVITRHGDNADFVVAINHRDDAVTLDVAGHDLLSGETLSGEWELGAGDVAVIRTASASEGGGN